ncbi:MAG: AAA family ATPase [Candidatus Rokubacteria bacterium]|nr:AAA family ATPase [Candidatus Rokubacteria bacterium]
MYTAHFGLKEPPFTITPDPRYLFMSERHREALAHLLYGAAEGGGFVQLTGEVGTGKTTLCRCLLEQLPPKLDVALILNPKLTSAELLAAVCDELRIAYLEGTTSPKVLVDALYAYLLDAHARGRRTMLIVDEAQDLSADVLEQIRLLTNLETAREKLLQIILIGQPELIALLDREDLRQLAQRITARYHLQPFTEEETRAYIRHRLKIAGRTRGIFTERAMRRVHRASCGIPRLINIICDRALLGAYAQDRTHVDARMVTRAATEVRGRRTPRLALTWRTATLAAGLVVIAGVAAVVLAARPFGDAGDASVGTASRAAPPTSIAPTLTSTAPAPPSTTAAAPSVAAAPPSVAAAPPSAAVAPAPSAAMPAAATPVAAFVEASRTLRLAQVLADTTLPGDEVSAFTAVFTRWGIDDARRKARKACGAARAEGLGCVLRTGSWKRLRGYNLPAVIELVGPSGTRHFAAVLAVDDSTATLDVGGRRVTAPLSEVEPFWNGDFIVVWRPPAVTTVPLAPGVRARDVDWLRRRLAAIDGGSVTAKVPDLYDGELRERVVTFQRSRALDADGVVGEETLIHLMLALPEPGMPRLSAGSS